MEKRFYDISILRVMAMLLVVYYHCICPYYVWSGIDSAGFVNPIYEKVCFDLTGIHMPLFFLIAGYLFGYKRFSRGGGIPIHGRSLLARPSGCLCRMFWSVCYC